MEKTKDHCYLVFWTLNGGWWNQKFQAQNLDELAEKLMDSKFPTPAQIRFIFPQMEAEISQIAVKSLRKRVSVLKRKRTIKRKQEEEEP